MDKDILENQIKGQNQKLGELRRERDAFIRANTLDEELDGARADMAKKEKDLKKASDDLREAKAERRALMNDICREIENAIGPLLPYGEAFALIDPVFSIGWKLPNRKAGTPHLSLSRGERVIFDAILGKAFSRDAKLPILLMEGAELDDKALDAVLELLPKTAGDNCQVFLSTCHEPDLKKADGNWWTVVEL